MPKLPVYLDNNSTTAIDPRVAKVMQNVISEHYGNPSSTTHPQGWYAEELVKIAREEVSELINADEQEIIFTSGATEALNLAIFGFVRSYRQKFSKKPHIITLTTEHKAVLDPLNFLAKDEIDLTVLDVAEDGILDLNRLETSCKENTALFVVMLANNEIGTIHPIKQISQLAKKHNSAVVCDATQAAGKIKVDVKDLNVDYLCLSAHKFYGPKGVGILYHNKNALELTPLIFGGGQERGFRAGTLNTPAIVGMGEAAKIINSEFESISKHLTFLSMYFLENIKKVIPDIELNGSERNRLPGNLNLYIPRVSNSQLIGQIQTKVAISISSACQSASNKPSHVLNALNMAPERQKSSIRIGIGRCNTEEEINYTIELFNAIIKRLR